MTEPAPPPSPSPRPVTSFVSTPGGTLRGEVRVPGDKSITHRALMLGAIAEGETRVQQPLRGEDCLATEAALRALGVTIETHGNGAELVVQGVGPHGLRWAAHPLDLGNSGTGMRLLCGLLAGQAFASTLIGDASLSRRPMGRVARPLQAMGARIETGENGCPPVTLHGLAAGARLQGIDYLLPVASAQVKSAVLLAGLYARGSTSVTEPAPTRDHTERMLTAFGVPVRRDGARSTLDGLADAGSGLRGQTVEVPADISSAAFFLVAASVCPGSDLLLRDVGINPTRTGIVDAMRLLGADLTLENERTVGAEPVADLRVRSARLRGARIPDALVPLAIDELPVLFVAAACAEGETLVTGAAELRVKESDRLAAMADGLMQLGVELELLADGMRIQGRPHGLRGNATVDSVGDHRIAMALAVAGQRTDAPITIENTMNVATSFPNFLELANLTGWRVEAGRG